MMKRETAYSPEPAPLLNSCTRCGERTEELFGCLCADCYKDDLESCLRDILDELAIYRQKYIRLTGRAFVL